MVGDVSRTITVRRVFPVSQSISGRAIDMAISNPIVTAMRIDSSRRKRSNREFSIRLARTRFQRSADETISRRQILERDLIVFDWSGRLRFFDCLLLQAKRDVFSRAQQGQ